ncbi:MAG TPA: APC family permease [Candidatus Acidoferrales bacterium]|nr:APC family permease [Candidatus Acidoferrales bacterium]
MSFLDVCFGKPLAASDERAEQLGVAAGIPIFGLDALSSAAYGPEAALTLLIPLGAAGIAYIVPISTSIVILLGIVYFSYRQTIAAYPNGGGSYTVASENLGTFAGLLAASALMIDYVLTVAVGISAGVGALVSAVPSLLPHTLLFCLVILLLITFVNLRGMRQAGIIFMFPTYLFIGSLLAALAFGVFKSIIAGGHPVPVAMPPAAPSSAVAAAASVWLLMQSFASGCTAMTGVEAVSNGVRAFREPVVDTSRRVLTVIIALLMVMLVGIAYLVRAYHIAATDPGSPGYQSVLSMIVAAVAGRGIFYYVTIGSVLVVLALSANTAFADFPRLCRAIALNGYLPDSFSLRGRRLVYSLGVYVLAILAGSLLIVFRGVTNRLIPLYAVGAFLAFTLSQAGMVAHWKKNKGRGSGRSMFVNGLGAIATGATVIVVLVAKFIEGAWITAVLIPALLLLMMAVKRYFVRVEDEILTRQPLEITPANPPLVVLPVYRWSKPVQKGLQFALTISTDIRAVHVCREDEKEQLKADWACLVEEPARRAGTAVPKYVELASPYRLVITPVVDYVLMLQVENPNRQIVLIVPELIEHHWYHYFLQSNRGELLKGLMLLRGNQNIAIINLPWYLGVT